jgi:hypothetical protein
MRTGGRSARLGKHRSITCGAPPRSGCRRWAVDATRDSTCARTRLSWSESTATANRLGPTSRQRGPWPPDWPTGRSLSFATTWAIRSRHCRASARAAAPSLASPTSVGAATTTSVTAQRRCRRSRFVHVLGTGARISEYQVTQTVAGADIVVVGNPDVELLITSLVAALRRYGLSEPTVRIRVADSLQRHGASGKLRRFVPL